MATRLDDYVSILITRQSAGITAPGFGVPMVLGYSATWGDRVRYYQDLGSIEDDGFAVDSPEYLAAQAILSQSPSVVQLAIGRGTTKPTLSYEIGATVANPLVTYTLTAEGSGVTSTPCTYAAGAVTNLGQINDALVVALNAVVGKNFTATLATIASSAGRTFTVASQTEGELTSTAHGFLTGDGPVQLTTTGTLPTGLAASTNYWVIEVDANTIQFATSLANALAGTFIVLSSNGTPTNTATPQGGALSPALPFTVTGNAAANWFSISLSAGEEAMLSSAMQTTGCSAAQLQADLNAIVASPGGAAWYGLTTCFNSQTLMVGGATWAEGNGRIYCAATPETANLATAYSTGSTEDTLSALETADYTRTIGAYHQRPNQFMGAAWLGVMLPFQPGSATWKFKQLAGVDVSVFTETQRTNLISRNGNGYEAVAQLFVTFNGTCSDGEFMDAIVGDDWVKANMQAACFNVMATTPGKVPYEDTGVSLLVSAITGILRQAQAMKIYAKTPDINVVAGKVASQSDSDKGNRIFRDINWTATRSGAIQTLIVQGTVSL